MIKELKTAGVLKDALSQYSSPAWPRERVTRAGDFQSGTSSVLAPVAPALPGKVTTVESIARIDDS